MNRFYKTYLKIINEQVRPLNNEIKEFNDELQSIYPANEWFLDLHKIINETIKAAELTPVPDDVLIECYRNLDLISNRCFKISYRKIMEIVEKSSYELSDVFIKCLKKYANDITGNLYVFKGNIDDLENFYDIYETSLFKRMKTVIDDEDRIFEFISSLLNMKKSDGLTIIKRDLDFENHKDCLIYISSTVDNFKDVMEHEFTHFIQRVCQFDEELPKVYDHSLKAENKAGFIKAVNEVTAKMNVTGLNRLSLIQFLNDKLQISEQHQTIKSMIKFFIRRYEKDNRRFEVNHRMLKISQVENTDENIRIRLQWLDELLHKNEFLDLEDYLNEKTNQTIEVKEDLMLLIFKAVKYEFKEYDIDKIIVNEFKTFRFRNF